MIHTVHTPHRGNPQTWLLGGILLLLILLFLHGHGWAQSPNGLQNTGNQTVNVNCLSGCSGSSGSNFGSAFPSAGTAIGVKNGANMVNLFADGSGNLFVNCATGCSGSSFLDNAAFTAGTTPINLTGGWYSTSPTNCTSGSGCVPQLTIDRKLFVQAFQGTSPWVDSITTWGGGTLGAMAAYGSSPGAVLVPGVNAFVTNTVTVSGTVTTTPPANASTNVAQFGGSNVVTGTGVSGAGIPRVTVSSDSFPATQAVSGTVTANQGTSPWLDNVTQFGSTNISTGTGASGAGIPRVTVSNDSNILATQSGTWTGRIVGNAGATLDAANGTTAPANGLMAGGYYASPRATLTAGQFNALSLDSDGSLLMQVVDPLPAGFNNIGSVNIANLPATQNVKVTNTNLAPIPVYNQAPVQVFAVINGVLTPVQLIEGQAAMAQSVPVVIASNQSAVPVTIPSVTGLGPDQQAHAIAVDNAGVQFVRTLGLPLQPCNAVRTTNCQHF